MAFPLIDIPTSITLLVLGHLVMTAVLLAYRTGMPSNRNIQLFVTGSLLQAIALWLFGLRGQIPDLFSVLLANPLGYAGLACEALAIGTVASWNRRLAAQLTAIGAIGSFVFLYFSGQVDTRVAVASTVLGLMHGTLAIHLLFQQKRSGLRLALGNLCLLLALAFAARATIIAGHGPSFHLLAPSFVQTLTILPLYVFMIVGGIGYLLLLKEQADTKLIASEAMYRSLVEQVSESITIIQDGRVVFANRKALESLETTPESLIGQELTHHVWPEDRALVLERHQLRIKNGTVDDNYDTRLLLSSGEPLWVNISASRIAWNGRPAVLALISDISGRKRLEEQLSTEALLDPLTGCFNRRGIEHHASRFLSSEQPLAAAMIDVDHFKQINDQYGHAIGDAVLVELARLLKKSNRSSDLVGRMGGEEFLILFNAEPDNAQGFCERIRRTIATHGWEAIQPGLQVTISIGLAISRNKIDLAILCLQADTCLYRAKQEGRNRVIRADLPS